MKNNNTPYWLLAAIALIYIFAAVVEPCDGHSCKGETHESVE